jgi:hypothetical protein
MEINRQDMIVEITYPGQMKRRSCASHRMAEHYLTRDWDLHFVTPVDDFKEALEDLRRAR